MAEIRAEFEDESKGKTGTRKCESENLSSEKPSIPPVFLHRQVVLARPVG